MGLLSFSIVSTCWSDNCFNCVARRGEGNCFNCGQPGGEGWRIVREGEGGGYSSH